MRQSENTAPAQDAPDEQPRGPGRPRRALRIIDTRPAKQVEIDLRQVEELAALMCSPEEASGVLGLSRATMYRYLDKDEAIKEAWDRGRQDGCVSLRRTQFKLAQSSAAMAIFLGKQYLGQRDMLSHELTGHSGGPVEQTVVHKTWHDLVESALKPKVPKAQTEPEAEPEAEAAEPATDQPSESGAEPSAE